MFHTKKTKKSSGKNKILVLVVLFSLLFTLGAENFFTSQDGVVSTNPSRILPRASDFWVNTSITIDATATTHDTHSGNWTWASDQDWCTGIGNVDQPYLIENMTFVANPSSNGLLINNSVGIYFTIQNCTFTNALSSGYAGLQLDNTDNGTIIGCNVSNNHRGIYFKENCNYNTVAFNDVNISSFIGVDIFNNCNYNNISYNTVTHADYSSWDYGQGIYLRTDCNYNYITYNNLSANDEGIKLSGNCNDNQILNNNISKSNFEGLYIDSGSSYNEIRYNLVDDNYYGIYVDNADENEISFNMVQNNEKNGIWLIVADNNTIFNNTLYNNGFSNLVNSAGILLSLSNFNTVFNNTADGSNLVSTFASNNTFSENTFSRGGLAKYNGMWLTDNSDNNTLINNMITGYSSNIRVYLSRENHIIDNTVIDGNNFGLSLSSAHNSTLTGNVIVNCGKGIDVGGSDNVTISKNQITGSIKADICLTSSEYLILSENSMENKGMDIYDIYHNQIDTSNTVGGKPIYYYEDQDNLYLDGNIMTDLAQLFMVNSTNSTITNFDIHQKSIGLYFDRCASLNILNNNVSENLGEGLHLIGVNDSNIESNIFNNNTNGIYYEGEYAPTFDEENPDFDLLSGNNVFSNNYICYNTVEGFEGEYGHHDNFSSNIIMHNGYNGIYFYCEYFASLTDNIVSNNSEQGILLSDSMNCSITNNTIQFNLYEGICLDYSSDTAVHANQISENELGGILISGSYGCDILDNELISNLDFGLYCEDADDAIISGNSFWGTNGTGVYLDSDSEENLIYYNDFLDNIVHAEDYGALNEWFLGTVGNYWDNYTGTDADNDGIGDQPYDISGTADSQDLYPMLDLFDPTIEAGDDCLIAADSPHTLSWVVSDSHPDMYYITRNGSIIQSPDSWTNGTISYDISADSLTDGTYVFTLWINDTNSNLNFASILVTVDSIAPTITSPENLTISPDFSSVLVNWTLADLHPGEYSISFNGSVVVPFTTWTNGVITYNLSIADLPPGNYTLTITVRDLVGNENTYDIIIVIEEEDQTGNAGLIVGLVILGVGIAGIAGFVIYKTKRG